MALEELTVGQQTELPNIEYDSVLEHPEIYVQDLEVAAFILGMNANSFITNVRSRYPWLFGEDGSVTLGRLELHAHMKAQSRGPYSEERKLEQLDGTLEKLLSAEDLYSSQPSSSVEGYRLVKTLPRTSAKHRQRDNDLPQIPKKYVKYRFYGKYGPAAEAFVRCHLPDDYLALVLAAELTNRKIDYNYINQELSKKLDVPSGKISDTLQTLVSLSFAFGTPDGFEFNTRLYS